MIGPTQIANKALAKLGAQPILSIDDTQSVSSRLMKALFDTVRDQELAMYRWKFAIRRAELPALADRPLYGYARAFRLPVDFLALVQVNHLFGDIPHLHGKPLWSIESGEVLSDLGAPLRIRYISRTTDYSLYSALFIDVLACKLAIEAVDSIKASNSSRQLLWQEYQQAVSRAMRTDAIEKAPDVLQRGEWLNVREGTNIASWGDTHD